MGLVYDVFRCRSFKTGRPRIINKYYYGALFIGFLQILQFFIICMFIIYSYNGVKPLETAGRTYSVQ